MSKKRTRYYSRDAMDHYLGTLGLLRKQTAADGSSVFRAVSEQLYKTQAYHGTVRQLCMEYLEVERQLIRAVKANAALPAHAELTNRPHAIMQALSMLFRRDFVVYRDVAKAPVNLTANRYPVKVFLCETFGGHFDSVLNEHGADTLGLCQSIVYELLYERVFGVDEAAVARAVSPFVAAASAPIGAAMTVPTAADATSYTNVEYDAWLQKRKGEALEHRASESPSTGAENGGVDTAVVERSPDRLSSEASLNGRRWTPRTRSSHSSSAEWNSNRLNGDFSTSSPMPYRKRHLNGSGFGRAAAGMEASQQQCVYAPPVPWGGFAPTGYSLATASVLPQQPTYFYQAGYPVVGAPFGQPVQQADPSMAYGYQQVGVPVCDQATLPPIYQGAFLNAISAHSGVLLADQSWNGGDLSALFGVGAEHSSGYAELTSSGEQTDASSKAEAVATAFPPRKTSASKPIPRAAIARPPPMRFVAPAANAHRPRVYTSPPTAQPLQLTTFYGPPQPQLTDGAWSYAGGGAQSTQPSPSYSEDGRDLPFHDMATLRYFYNLGCEYHRHATQLQEQSQLYQ